ncbi:gluconate 5-dehydrogenase [Aspergillus flavus]|nr:short-chain type dehydrogenase [Aspergillus flavus]RAQ48458.1 gluconate 5-dehydrogenase [Aspergillus flavus]
MVADPRPQTLAGKVAIVTGATRGIGAGLAEELARRGAKVLITYTSASSEPIADKLIEKIKNFNNGSKAAKVRADLRDLSAGETIVEASIQAFGPNIDILVNNAGVEVVKPLSDLTVEDYNLAYDLNVRGAIFLTQAVLPHLRAPGRIINISSVGARAGFANLSIYCSSKAALEGLTRCWAAELGDAGHTVNAVNPGPVQTALLENIPKELVEMQKSATPVEHRVGTIDDVAQVVAWLASEESRWVSGQAIAASGGFAMY